METGKFVGGITGNKKSSHCIGGLCVRSSVRVKDGNMLELGIRRKKVFNLYWMEEYLN